ncbi:MAG: integration host factor subunit alpha [Legionellales bacterium]|nr:MAG: integration host factor subunit alpha [Legionellales bacterium]
MATVTKRQLSNRVAQRIPGVSQQLTLKVVQEMFTVIKNLLLNGISVKLTDLGTFKVLDKQQRPGRNPKTGEDIVISARRVVTFHNSPKLKEGINAKNNGS